MNQLADPIGRVSKQGAYRRFGDSGSAQKEVKRLCHVRVILFELGRDAILTPPTKTKEGINMGLGALGVAAILNLIWAVVMFFVPFIVIGINAKAARTERNTEMMLALLLANSDDSKLPPRLLAQKYEIRGGNEAGGYFYDGRSFTDIGDAVAAARLKTGSQ